MIDGVMYIPTGNDDIFALDAKTGKKLWEYSSDIPQTNDLICCGWDNRGVASGEGKIFSGQLDGSFVALDQKTGKVAWRTQLEDYHDGYSMTGYYRYFDGLVFTGMSGGENGIRGRMYGLDAKTGQEVWRFYTVAGPGEVGGDSWPATSDAYTHGGATVWQAPVVDPDLGMAYFSTGNAGPDYDGSVRPGDNLPTGTIAPAETFGQLHKRWPQRARRRHPTLNKGDWEYNRLEARINTLRRLSIYFDGDHGERVHQDARAVAQAIQDAARMESEDYWSTTSDRSFLGMAAAAFTVAWSTARHTTEPLARVTLADGWSLPMFASPMKLSRRREQV